MSLRHRSDATARPQYLDDLAIGQRLAAGSAEVSLEGIRGMSCAGRDRSSRAT